MKFIKLLFATILSVIVLSIVTGLVFLALVTDTSKDQPYYIENESVYDISSGVIGNAIDEAGTNKKINLEFCDYDLNVILKSVTSTLNESISGSNIEIETLFVSLKGENSFSFVCYFKVFGIRSSLRGTLELSTSEEGVIFTTKEVKLASLTLDANFFESLNINKSLNENLNKNGMDLSFSNGVITISIEHEYVNNLFKSMITGTDSEIYSLIFETFMIDNPTYKIEPNKFSIGINIEKFDVNPQVDPDIPYQINFEGITVALKDLLVRELIKFDEMDTVAAFFIYGYDSLTQEEKSIIDNLYLYNYGIAESKDHKGIKQNSVDLTSEIIDSYLQDGNLKISEESLNINLMNSSFVGKMYCFAHFKNNGYDANYIAIESLYTKINDGGMNFYLTISINGLSLILKIDTTLSRIEGLKTSLKINSIYLGEVEIENQNVILGFLEEMVKDNWININNSKKEIVIDFTNIFSKSNELQSILDIYQGLNISLEVVDTKGFVTFS